MLHAYIAQLKRDAETRRAVEQACRDENARAKAKAARTRLTPSKSG
jgi:outer membrane murein-binding lipoprotein Lpp